MKIVGGPAAVNVTSTASLRRTAYHEVAAHRHTVSEGLVVSKAGAVGVVEPPLLSHPADSAMHARTAMKDQTVACQTSCANP